MSRIEALNNLAAAEAAAARYAHKPANNPFRREAARTLREARALARAYAA